MLNRSIQAQVKNLIAKGVSTDEIARRCELTRKTVVDIRYGDKPRPGPTRGSTRDAAVWNKPSRAERIAETIAIAPPVSRRAPVSSDGDMRVGITSSGAIFHGDSVLSVSDAEFLRDALTAALAQVTGKRSKR